MRERLRRCLPDQDGFAVAQDDERQLMAGAEFIPGFFGAGAEDRAVANDHAARGEARIEIIERGQRRVVERHVEMHERPGALGQCGKDLRYPSRAERNLRKFTEEPAYQFRRNIGLGDREKRFPPRRTVGGAHRNQVMFARGASTDEAVDQVKVAAREAGIAAAPCVSEQERGCAAEDAAFRACARQVQRREKILQQVAAALKSVKDIERRDGGAGVREAALIQVEKTFLADGNVVKKDAQVFVDRRRTVQTVERLFRLEWVFGRVDCALRLKSAVGQRASGMRAAPAGA